MTSIAAAVSTLALSSRSDGDAQGTHESGPGLPNGRAMSGCVDEPLERAGQRAPIGGWQQDAAAGRDDLGRAAEGEGHDRQSGVERFDEGDPERLRMGV